MNYHLTSLRSFGDLQGCYTHWVFTLKSFVAVFLKNSLVSSWWYLFQPFSFSKEHGLPFAKPAAILLHPVVTFCLLIDTYLIFWNVSSYLLVSHVCVFFIVTISNWSYIKAKEVCKTLMMSMMMPNDIEKTFFNSKALILSMIKIQGKCPTGTFRSVADEGR